MHAGSMGAIAKHVASVEELKMEMMQARSNDRTTVLVIDTTATDVTEEGGAWWEVAIPEVSPRPEINAAYALYLQHKHKQKL